MVEEVYNKYLIAWVSGQYGETLHSCAVFSLTLRLGKILCTLVQYLTILTANPCSMVYVRYAHATSFSKTPLSVSTDPNLGSAAVSDPSGITNIVPYVPANCPGN